MARDEVFWTLGDDIIINYFNDFIKNQYNGFRFMYNWKNFPQIKSYLIRLMYNSFSNDPAIRKQLPDIIHDVEIFFASGIACSIITNSNLPNILNNLKDKSSGCRIIEFLPQELSGVFGNSTGNRVQINPYMTRHPNSLSLTEREIRRLYLFHEMGHKILNILDDDVIDYYISTIDSILLDEGLTNADLKYKSFIREGFWMIEECLTQSLAEYLTYYSANKERPHYSVRRDLGCNVETNLDYYGIFQMPTINLGRTIRGCSKVGTSNDQVLLNMIKKALNSNFASELIAEYDDGDAKLYYDLFLTLRAMGMVKVQKYASFGIGQSINLDVGSCLDAINSITIHNRDYRDYPEGGYPTSPMAPMWRIRR